MEVLESKGRGVLDRPDKPGDDNEIDARQPTHARSACLTAVNASVSLQPVHTGLSPFTVTLVPERVCGQ